MTEYRLIENYLGYSAKKDITNTDPRYLIKGSKNVLINDNEKIITTPGSTIDGQSNSSLFGIKNSYDWNTSTETEINIRCYDDEIEYRYVSSDGTVTWRRLLNGITFNKVRFAEWWDTNEKKDTLLFVIGNSNIYSWSGAVTTFASATSNSITKEGTNTWAQDRFLINGTKKIIIDGVEYTYTGGESTTTLTGVTPSPLTAGHTAGAVVHQSVVITENKPANDFTNDLITNLKNQIYVGSHTRRDVFISKITDYDDFSYSSPRLPGEGMLLTLDSCPTGFINQDDVMYVSAGKNDWYQVVFTLSSDTTKEAVTIEKLKSGPRQAAKSQETISRIKNSIIFISNEPTLDSLGRIENINTPQSVPLSDIIKNDFNEYNFSDAQVKYFRNQTFIALPFENVVLIYDHQNGYWQPPQEFPVSCFSIINGELYAHSNSTPETYKFMDPSARTFNGFAIEHIARFAYRNFDKKANRKKFDRYYNEGYILPGTIVNVSYLYEFEGSLTSQEKTIDPSDNRILFGNLLEPIGFGKNALGKKPLGRGNKSLNDYTKFRRIHNLTANAVYEYTVEYSSFSEGYGWQLLAHGPNAIISTSDNVDITS